MAPQGLVWPCTRSIKQQLQVPRSTLMSIFWGLIFHTEHTRAHTLWTYLLHCMVGCDSRYTMRACFPTGISFTSRTSLQDRKRKSTRWLIHIRRCYNLDMISENQPFTWINVDNVPSYWRKLKPPVLWTTILQWSFCTPPPPPFTSAHPWHKFTCQTRQVYSYQITNENRFISVLILKRVAITRGWCKCFVLTSMSESATH